MAELQEDQALEMKQQLDRWTAQFHEAEIGRAVAEEAVANLVFS